MRSPARQRWSSGRSTWRGRSGIRRLRGRCWTTLNRCYAIACTQPSRPGDPTAIGFLCEAASHLGAAIANVLSMLDLELVLVGGEMAVVCPSFVDTVREVVRTQAYRAAPPDIRVLPSAFGLDVRLVRRPGARTPRPVLCADAGAPKLRRAETGHGGLTWARTAAQQSGAEPQRRGTEDDTPMTVQSRRPNILFFHVDNLGMGELGCYGGGIVRGAETPAHRRLCARGLPALALHRRAAMHALALGADDGALRDPLRHAHRRRATAAWGWSPGSGRWATSCRRPGTRPPASASGTSAPRTGAGRPITASTSGTARRAPTRVHVAPRTPGTTPTATCGPHAGRRQGPRGARPRRPAHARST